MQQVNRYFRFAKISEARFRHLLRCFALDLSATQTAKMTGISVRISMGDGVAKDLPSCLQRALGNIPRSTRLNRSHHNDNIPPPKYPQQNLAPIARRWTVKEQNPSVC